MVEDRGGLGFKFQQKRRKSRDGNRTREKLEKLAQFSKMVWNFLLEKRWWVMLSTGLSLIFLSVRIKNIISLYIFASQGILLIVLFLPFRDYSFIVDEDDFALLETLEEKKQKEEEEMDSMWPQYYEREEKPLPPLDTTHHWDGHPPPHLLQHELFLLPFLVTGFLFFCLAAVAIFKPPLSLIKLNLILALHGLFIILIQVPCPILCQKSQEQI